MPDLTPELLARIPIFRHVGAEDRHRLVAEARLRHYERGDAIFGEGDPSELLFILVAGRVKVFKARPDGSDLILEIFGPGNLLGAVAAYQSRPYPAGAQALEPSTCLLIGRDRFFALLEAHPSLVRGLLGSLSHRLVELTSRLADLTGGRIEVRLARLFLKLADQIGRPERGGTLIPLPLSRQELADLTGTTIETSIRIMSRWNKEDVLRTEKDGFVLVDRAALEATARA